LRQRSCGARLAKSSVQATCLLAIASILKGASRSNAAKIACTDWQTLRDWVYRYNAGAMEGLPDRQRLAASASTDKIS
jgi:transposase